MSSATPEMVIRLGSHAEKEYVLKLGKFFDGLIVGGNLFESTPGATASLLLKMRASETNVYLDPMTYAFGMYEDRSTGKVRDDLDWIKSDQLRKDKRGRKTKIRDFKRSYKSLSQHFGEPVASAIRTETALSPDSFADATVARKFCRQVINYQWDRIRDEFASDDELKDLVDDAPRPAAVFAPYFYIEPSQASDWTRTTLKLMKASARLRHEAVIHGVVCADVSCLEDQDFLNTIITGVADSGVSGVWLWFSRFFEERAPTVLLSSYRDLVEKLSEVVEDVYSMHGGLFSLGLSDVGMTGISHGIGYGEQKDVIPVIGQSTPTVRYYLPAVARRLGVPAIERALDGMGIEDVDDFHEQVCGCAICRGVVANSVDEFREFGAMRFSTPDSRRKAQTPAAAKRCRYHFLLARIRERDYLRTAAASELAVQLEEAAESWGEEPSLERDCSHLLRWANVLSESEVS